MTVAEAVLSGIAIMLALPVFILLAEVLCAFKAKKGSDPLRLRPSGKRVAVLVPSHDEEEGIGATISRIAEQLSASDRLIVVADNCTDGTAERALTAGAETIERFDPQRRGKGYALDFGVRHMESDPPDFVVIIDADCRIAPGTIDTLVAQGHRCAVQAFYGMCLSTDSDVKRRIAGFAWIVKTHVRPMGLAVMGLPCQLMGSGMAFPWEAIRQVDLATGNIVEDVKMGLDLAAMGYAPIYCPEAQVESDFPASERGFEVQRRRWESGSLHMIVKIAPAMFLRGLMSLNVPLMAMAVDIMVPPLMMLLFTLALGFALSFVHKVVGGSGFPTLVFGVSLLILVLTLAIAWFRFGRDVLPARDVLALPGVFFRKFGFYITMWRGRTVGWIRTDRK